MAHGVDPERAGHGSRLIKLATLCRAYLGRELDKNTKIRTGDWAGELNEVQKACKSSALVLRLQLRWLTFGYIIDAANDVFVSVQIFNALKKLAEERNVTLDLDGWSSSVPGHAERTATLATSGMTVIATRARVPVNGVLKPAATMPGGLPSQAMGPGRIDSSSQEQNNQSQARTLIASQMTTTINHAQNRSQARPDVQVMAQVQNHPQLQQPQKQSQFTSLPTNVGRRIQITGPGSSNKKSASITRSVIAPPVQRPPQNPSQPASTALSLGQVPAHNQLLPQAQPSSHIVHSDIRPCANTTGNAHPFLYGADEKNDEFEPYDAAYGLVDSFQMGTSNPMYAAVHQHWPFLPPPITSSYASARQMGQRTPAQILSAMGPGPSRSKSRNSTSSNSKAWGKVNGDGAGSGCGVVLRGKLIHTPPGAKPPPPAKMKSLTAFLDGKTFERIAVEKSIKLTTCQ